VAYSHGISPLEDYGCYLVLETVLPGDLDRAIGDMVRKLGRNNYAALGVRAALMPAHPDRINIVV
jgi:hypothetical protein